MSFDCECKTTHYPFSGEKSSKTIDDCDPYDLVWIITCDLCKRQWLRVLFEQPFVTAGTHFFDALLPENHPPTFVPQKQSEIETVFLNSETCYLGGSLYANSPQPVYKHVGIPKRQI